MIVENRHILKGVAEAVLYCGRQCIAPRGNSENLQGSGNAGNFLALMRVSVNPPPPPQIAVGICLVHVLKYCSYYVSEHEAWADKIFKRFLTLRTDYQTPRSCNTRGTPRSH